MKNAGERAVQLLSIGTSKKLETPHCVSTLEEKASIRHFSRVHENEA